MPTTFPTDVPVSRCFYGDVNLAFNRTLINGSFESIGGYLEICVDGQFIAVCNESADLNVTHLAEITCQQLGYYG